MFYRVGDLNYRNNPAYANPEAEKWTHEQKWQAIHSLVQSKYVLEY